MQAIPNFMTTHHRAAILALPLLLLLAVHGQNAAAPASSETRPSAAVAPADYPLLTLPLKPVSGETIALIGNTLGERTLYYGHFETVLHQRFPGQQLTVRNLCHPGDTAGLRPRPGTTTQWAFPDAARFNPDHQTHFGKGHYPTPDEWLTEVKATTIIAFFGFNESFGGPERLEDFKAELAAWIEHTQTKAYDGRTAPRIVLVTPIAFEDRSSTYDLPKGVVENARLAAYAKAMLEVAAEKRVAAVDAFGVTREWYTAPGAQPLTRNGCHLSEAGYRRFDPFLVDAIFGRTPVASTADYEGLRAAIVDKEWFWLNDYRMLNGVHAYGQRWKPYGEKNYPEEIEKIRQMTRLRDEAVWKIAQGKASRLVVDDRQTRALSPVVSNYLGAINYLEEAAAAKKFKVAAGYKIGLFASEKEFPLLQKPVQMSFDNRGRLWVAVMPSYPHYQPGAARPNDKLLILEDTNHDGRADKMTVFADGLHIPSGFELAPEGVYLAQQPNLVLLKDTDGDDRADESHIIMGGFDSHDTHHSISAFTGDPSGAFYMLEGRFLHSQIETPYGPVRCTDGGVFRFDPRSWRMERFSQSDYNNPWGIAFDQWGQNFIADASNGANYWLLPLSVNIPHGKEIEKEGQFTTHRVRPTSGTEFIYSRHFPDSVQGDYLVNNTIGFLGTKQHTVVEDGAGYSGELRQDLVYSADPNYRPCDLEFAPDGSLYIIDWQNALIGHMQHSARDPNRDVTHGRIYRITHPGRPLVAPPHVAGAPIAALLENLKLPEFRARYRTHRELRGRRAAEVILAVKAWAARLDREAPDYERHLVEALWVTWGQGQVDPKILELSLASPKHEARAAAARVLRYSHAQVANSTALFLKAAADDHPRVRLEAMVAASWLDNADGARIALEAMQAPVGKWMGHALDAALWTLRDDIDRLAASGAIDLANNAVARDYLAGKVDFRPQTKAVEPELTNLSAESMDLYRVGKEVYQRDGHCVTCHQADGKGLPNIYPSLSLNEWVQGDEERLIKIVLKGLWGDIEVGDQKFEMNKGVPPMIGFGPMLTDKEIAGALTYVRQSFENKLLPVKTETVTRVREQTKDRVNYYTVEELIRENPFPPKLRGSPTPAKEGADPGATRSR